MLQFSTINADNHIQISSPLRAEQHKLVKKAIKHEPNMIEKKSRGTEEAEERERKRQEKVKLVKTQIDVLKTRICDSERQTKITLQTLKDRVKFAKESQKKNYVDARCLEIETEQAEALMTLQMEKYEARFREYSKCIELLKRANKKEEKYIEKFKKKIKKQTVRDSLFRDARCRVIEEIAKLEETDEVLQKSMSKLKETRKMLELKSEEQYEENLAIVSHRSKIQDALAEILTLTQKRCKNKHLTERVFDTANHCEIKANIRMEYVQSQLPDVK